MVIPLIQLWVKLSCRVKVMTCGFVELDGNPSIHISGNQNLISLLPPVAERQSLCWLSFDMPNLIVGHDESGSKYTNTSVLTR